MKPRSTEPPTGIPKPGRRHDDDTKLPIGDTSGEMEDAGGGRKTASKSPTPTPVEPQGEDHDEKQPPTEASEAARPDRGRSNRSQG